MGQISKEKLRNLKRHTYPNNLTTEKSTRRKTNSIPKRPLESNQRNEKPNRVRSRVTQRSPNPKGIQSTENKAISWHWHWSHPYLMTAFTFLVALTVTLLHGLDLLIEWPFHGAIKYYDAVACICGIVLIVLCFPVYRDLPKYATKR